MRPLSKRRSDRGTISCLLARSICRPRLLWGFCALCLVLPVSAAEGPWAPFLSPILQKENLQPSQVGLEVLDLATGQILFSEGAHQGLNPASTIKLVTAATALWKLGPAHHFETIVSLSGKDVCLIGRGDPSLVEEQLWLMAEEALRSGLSTIEGDLILDESFFPVSRELVTDFEADEDRAFAASLGALSMNYNSLTIYVEPTTIGRAPRVSLDPQLPLLQLENLAKTSVSGGRKDLSASIESKDDRWIVHVQGKIGLSSKRISLFRSVPDPALYVGHMFTQHFRRAGGMLVGNLKKGICPTSAVEFLRFSSKPLSQIIMDLNKFSNNFIAEMLLRQIADQPDPQKGLDVMKQWLKASNIEAPELVLENASGLSRRNRVSAHTLASIVRKAILDFYIGPELRSSLGISGLDGTLKRRFSGANQKGVVRAKSGSLLGAVSLAGLLRTDREQEVAFAFLFNCPRQQNWRLQKLEEQLLATMARLKQ